MRKFSVILLALLLLAVGCAPETPGGDADAETILAEIVERFSLCDGVIYSDAAGARYPFTDAMKERMFPSLGLPAFAFVEGAALYVSRRFSDRELLVLKLCDPSHRAEVMRLCRLRAAKKKNAVVLANGVYVYLICTDRNAEIAAYLR